MKTADSAKATRVSVPLSNDEILSIWKEVKPMLERKLHRTLFAEYQMRRTSTAVRPMFLDTSVPNELLDLVSIVADEDTEIPGGGQKSDVVQDSDGWERDYFFSDVRARLFSFKWPNDTREGQAKAFYSYSMIIARGLILKMRNIQKAGDPTKYDDRKTLQAVNFETALKDYTNGDSELDCSMLFADLKTPDSVARFDNPKYRRLIYESTPAKHHHVLDAWFQGEFGSSKLLNKKGKPVKEDLCQIDELMGLAKGTFVRRIKTAFARAKYLGAEELAVAATITAQKVTGIVTDSTSVAPVKKKVMTLEEANTAARARREAREADDAAKSVAKKSTKPASDAESAIQGTFVTQASLSPMVPEVSLDKCQSTIAPYSASQRACGRLGRASGRDKQLSIFGASA